MPSIVYSLSLRNKRPSFSYFLLSFFFLTNNSYYGLTLCFLDQVLLWPIICFSVPITTHLQPCGFITVILILYCHHLTPTRRQILLWYCLLHLIPSVSPPKIEIPIYLCLVICSTCRPSFHYTSFSYHHISPTVLVLVPSPLYLFLRMQVKPLPINDGNKL